MTHFDAVAVPPSITVKDLPVSTFVAGGVGVAFPTLQPADVARISRVLKARRPTLTERRTDDLVAALGRVGARFLESDDPIRQEALALLPPTSGLSREMAEVVLDGMARDWTEERLRTLLETEFADAGALDGFVTVRGRRAMAVGPALCVQVVAGSVPGVGVGALLRSLLVKAPTLLKPGRGDVVLPVLFARALRADDARLADALAITYWPGGSQDLERAALAEAEFVVGYGSDETVNALRSHASVTTRFVGYHHRVSVGAVGVEALTKAQADRTATDVALAVALFDQRGCVSPQVIYVEESGAVCASDFTERLAVALGDIETRLPGGRLGMEEASALQQLRGTAELLAASGSSELHHGGSGAAWTVILETEAGPTVSGAGRVVRVLPFRDVGHLVSLLEPLAGHLQTLGVAGFGDRLEALAACGGRVGVARVAPFGSVAFPPPWWRHDGRGPLTDLVRWVELG